MHRPAFMFVLLATLAHQQTQPAAGGGTASASCIPHERDALLAFKHGVKDPAGLLSSWRGDGGLGDQDCCRWRGVRCSNRTGHVQKLKLQRPSDGTAFVGQISPSLLALEHLEHLDLSNNGLEGPTGHLPEFLGSLKSLKHLSLSGIQFRGGIPPQLGNLSKLQYLDLSNMGATYSTDLSWLTRLPSIKYLNLNNVNLSTLVDWPHVMNMIPSLRVLSLSGCSLAGANQSLPHPHFNLTNLETLDASQNFFNHPMAISWFWNVTNLKYLDVSYNRLYGQIPHTLGIMTSLEVLDLTNCTEDDDERNMRIMNIDLKNLCNLEVLNLFWASLQGDVTELFKNLPRCSPNKLQVLDLGMNQLTGMLPRWIGKLTSLVILDLSWNNITGSLPASLGQFTDLGELYLSFNHLTGNVTEEHFASARSLQYIDLSYNALKIDISSNWQPPFTLYTACFAACQMGPLFPRWLQWQANIAYLDISSAGIADRLPQWFSDAFSNVQFLNISNNKLIGGLPANMSFMSLSDLHLSSCQLSGQIPTMPPNIITLDLSKNYLQGPLPSDIGSGNLKKLSLFSNRITGHIPESFCKYQNLTVLDLSNNFLEGELPQCLGAMGGMKFIAFSNNSFSGEFPSFVQNFSNVQFLDLSRNKFSGRLPTWIGKFRSLIILRLSHNKFFGNIPINITNLACLQYMDLNNNEISGSLPSYLSNLKAMTKTYMTGLCDDDDDIGDIHLTSLFTDFKGQELNCGSISRILYTKMTSINLSANNLSGEIPKEITALDALVNLNLSWNHFSGVVPNKIGQMQLLESLDLKRNKLSGEIPSTLSSLYFLSYLNMSYNNLTGTIPSGGQLDGLYAANTFIYIGNIGLCGHPLENNCSRGGDASKQGHAGRTKSDNEIELFYLGLGCGFVVGIWVAFGTLLLKRSWRIAYFQLSDKLHDKVISLVTWASEPGTADEMVGSSTEFSQGTHE